MKHSNTRALYDYWDALRLTRSAPLRSELDPSNIKSILASVFILQQAGEDEYTFRLAGTELCRLFGRELRDENFLADWRRHEFKSVRSLLESIIEERTAAVLGVAATHTDDSTTSLEYLFLPVRLDSTKEIRIFGCCSVVGPKPGPLRKHVVRQEVASLRLLWPDNVSRFMETPEEKPSVPFPAPPPPPTKIPQKSVAISGSLTVAPTNFLNTVSLI